MAKVEKTITIHAPAEKISSHITKPTDLPEVWPSMVEVKGVTQLPNG